MHQRVDGDIAVMRYDGVAPGECVCCGVTASGRSLEYRAVNGLRGKPARLGTIDNWAKAVPVSYTHLTLPTILLV